jgi:signal transduction histidine kinase
MPKRNMKTLTTSQINNQAVQNADLTQAYRQKDVRLQELDRQLSALHSVTTAASESPDLDAVLHEVIREITEIFNFDATRIYLMNRQMTELNVRASFETNPKFFAKYTVFQKGQGNIGVVAATGKPLIYEDVHKDPLYEKLSHTNGVKRGGFSFWAGFPIRTRLMTLGAISCIGVKPRRLKAEEIQLIASMANQIAIGVKYAVLFEESQTAAREVSLLYYVAKVVNQSLDLKTLLCGVMHEVRKLFKFDIGRIGLLEANGQDLGILADEGRLRKTVPLNGEIMKKVLESRRPLFFEDIQNDPRYKKWTANQIALKEGFRAAFYLPIRAKDRSLGVIGFLGKNVHRFSPGEVRLIYSIAHHLGTAVENARFYEAARDSREQLRELAARIQVAREEERSRLARQVHDDLGQPLTALKMELAMASGMLGRNPKAGEQTTKPFFDRIDGMVETVRNIGEELRPAVLDDLGLTEAINWQAEDFQRRTGIQCKVTGSVTRNSLDSGRSVAVFRIFQEILSNVARHARADKIRVEWKKDSANVLLLVSDNGKGITARALTSNRSFGILGMRERALFCRGELNISGLPGKGTTVSLRIPAH